MKKGMKIVLIILSILVMTGCGCNQKEEESGQESESKENLNTNKGIMEEKTVEGITFKNAILLMDGEGMSNFKITVENNSGKAKTVETFKVTFKGKDGEVLQETYGYVGYELKDKESNEVMISLDQDMKEAYEVEYELEK